MSDGVVSEAFETTSGDVWYKAADSQGREYRVKQGEGRVSQQQYKAAKSHRPEVAISERGADPKRATENVSTYQSDRITPTQNVDSGSVEFHLAVERNRFLGYFSSRDTSDDREQAIEDYLGMVDELREADTTDEREGIRRKYGVGGS